MARRNPTAPGGLRYLSVKAKDLQVGDQVMLRSSVIGAKPSYSAWVVRGLKFDSTSWAKNVVVVDFGSRGKQVYKQSHTLKVADIGVTRAKSNPPAGTVDLNAARELVLYTENSSALARPLKSTYLALQRKVENGRWDGTKAPKAFMLVVLMAAKAYLKEFGSPGDQVKNVFSPATRMEACKILAKNFKEEHDIGNTIENPVGTRGTHSRVDHLKGGERIRVNSVDYQVLSAASAGLGMMRLWVQKFGSATPKEVKWKRSTPVVVLGRAGVTMANPRATAANLSSQWTTVQVRRVGGKVQLKVPVSKLKR